MLRASINCPDVGPGVKVSAGSTAKPVSVAAFDTDAVNDSSSIGIGESCLGMRNGFVGEQIVLQFVIHGRVTSAYPFQHHCSVLFLLIPVVLKDGA